MNKISFNNLFMNLLLNAVSKAWIIILFDNDRQIIDRYNIDILGNESSKLSNILDDFLNKNKLTYSNLENIIVVNWPWSFTWIRVISLLINTIAFVYKTIKLTEINFFELYSNYPIVKSSSKRDLFVKYKKDDKINIIKNEDLTLYMNNINIIYGDLINNFLKPEINFEQNINYDKIIKEIKFENKNIIKPLYIKKPSIT